MDARFDHAWERFRGLNSLTLVSDTVEGQWARGRNAYLAFLVPIEDAAVRGHISRVIRRIAAIPGVEPYPEPYWHMTVKGVGFEVEEPAAFEEIAKRDVTRIADAARSVFANESAFETRIGLANGFPEVVFLEVWNAGRVPRLNARLMDVITALARYPVDGANFLPHISIARFTSGAGLARLKDALAGLRDEDPGPDFAVDRIDLIRAHLGAAAPTFETIASYPFRGS